MGMGSPPTLKKTCRELSVPINIDSMPQIRKSAWQNPRSRHQGPRDGLLFHENETL